MGRAPKYPDGPTRFDYCPGCGYHWITHQHQHRGDCTLPADKIEAWNLKAGNNTH